MSERLLRQAARHATLRQEFEHLHEVSRRIDELLREDDDELRQASDPVERAALARGRAEHREWWVRKGF